MSVLSGDLIQVLREIADTKDSAAEIGRRIRALMQDGQ